MNDIHEERANINYSLIDDLEGEWYEINLDSLSLDVLLLIYYFFLIC